MAFDFDNALDKLASAKPSEGGGPYIDRGMGRITIEKIENRTVRNKDTGKDQDVFLATCRIDSCSPVADDEKPPHVVGTKASFFQYWDSEVGANNIVAFLMAVTGNPLSDFSKDLLIDPSTGKPIPVPGEKGVDGSQKFLTKGRAALTQITGPDQPLRGCVVDYATRKSITVKRKQVIHVPKFSHVAQNKEQIAGRRAELDTAGKAA